jgi:phage FluMu gp28-like protein
MVEDPTVGDGTISRVRSLIWALAEWECGHSLERFAKFVITRDEHGGGANQEDLEGTERPFPTRKEKAHIWEFLDAVLETRGVLCVEKSRQVMVTWAMVMYILWESKYKKNRLWFVQSKKEEDSASLVYSHNPFKARMSFIEAKLPEELRTLDFDNDCSYGEINFRDTGSVVKAIPEGGSQIRSYTASGIFADEAAFQPEFEEAYAAAKPTIDGGGKLIAVSTANPGAYLYSLLEL